MSLINRIIVNITLKMDSEVKTESLFKKRNVKNRGQRKRQLSESDEGKF